MRRKVVVLFVLVVMGLGLFAASGPESPTLAASGGGQADGILRYNGRGWSWVAPLTTHNLEDIAVLDSFNATAVGQNDAIGHSSPPGAPTETPTIMPTVTPVTRPVVDIILPSQPTVCTIDSLIWEATAYNPAVGTTNGAGIDQVVFRIFDNNYTLVYEKVERRTKYCGFGGDVDCYALPLSDGTWHAEDNSQTVGGPILVGMTYTLRATAYSTQVAGGASTNNSIQVTVLNCPTATPTSTPTPTWTPTATLSPTPTWTATPTHTPLGVPDLSASVKSASPTVVAYFEEIAYTITVRNTGSAAAQVELIDPPPLSYVAGSATGGIWWDDGAGLIRWQGTIAAGDSRIFQFRVHGPTPPIAHNTIYTNRVTLTDGVNPPIVRSIDVLANPSPTATSTPTATPTRTATPSQTPITRYLYVPVVLR